MSKNPWSFKIDYDRAIADDEREIAELEGIQKAMAAMLTDEERAFIAKHYRYTAIGFAHYSVVKIPDRLDAVLGALGLSKHDLACAMIGSSVHSKVPSDEERTFLDEHEPKITKNTWATSERIFGKLDDIYVLTEEDRVERLRKAKASLARHKRNKAKYGK